MVAEFLLELGKWHEHAPANLILADLEKRVSAVSGIDIEIRAERTGPQRGKPIQIDLTGGDVRRLDDGVRVLRELLATVPGLKGIEDSRPVPGIEWVLNVDRAEAARFGVDVARVGQYAKLVTEGLKLGRFESDTGEDEIDIMLRFPERFRTIDGLRSTRIATERGLIPLSRFATLDAVPRAGVIERIDGELARGIEADIATGVLESDVVREARAWLVGTHLPIGVEAKVRGEDEDRNEARDFLFRAFAAALFTMAMILVTQFNSFYSAFLILSAIVLSTVGVRLGLLIIDEPFSVIMSGVGVIALAGIVVNNNIILIDTYDRLRREGLSAYDALLRAGRTRLRPVLLTTVTTIAGLTPLVLRADIDYVERTLSFGAPSTQYWVQMSSAVVFGLAFATALTLFVTPAALMVRARLTEARALDHARADSESIRTAFERHGFPVGFATLTAIVAAWVFLPELILVRIVDIMGKQIFEQPPSRWFQSLESASFWSFTILGAAYAYWKNEHVRVDILRERLSLRGKAIVEIVGFVLLLAPVCIVILVSGWDFVVRSFVDEETSGALLGSPTQWLFKAMMLVCFAQLLLLGGYATMVNLRFLRGRAAMPFPPERTVSGKGVDEAQA